MSYSTAPLSLSGKVAIITGAGSGIGEGIALSLAKQGVKVVINGRTQSKLDTVAASIKQLGGEVTTFAGDIGKEEINKQLVEKAIQTYGALHIAVNNSGVFIGGLLASTGGTELDTLLDTNVKGVIYGMKYQLPVIAKYSSLYEQGVIINISSTVAQTVMKTHWGVSAAYSGTKAFVDVLTRVGALEGQPHHVRVNAISPGMVYTDAAKVMAPTIELFDGVASKSALIGRSGGIDEISSAVNEQIRNKFVNGAVWLVDGGSNVNA